MSKKWSVDECRSCGTKKNAGFRLAGQSAKKGNTHFLLSSLLDEAERLGARTQTIKVASRNIVPCKELVVCEKKGFCPIDDDMKHGIYALLREADVILLASPVFFYNVTAQLKALIHRCQTLWHADTG